MELKPRSTPLKARPERRSRPRPVNLHDRADLYGLEVAELSWDEWQLCVDLATLSPLPIASLGPNCKLLTSP